MRMIASAVLAGLVLLGAATVWAEPTAAAAADAFEVRKIGLGAAAALAIALSVIGAGYAVGRIGSAAMGAAAEKPELLLRSLVLVALAEGLAVLGFVIAMMLVQKI
ncbi:MAG TPA: ATP synthase subunit C [Polyangia bacterium]|jgi:V/A-type H+-transporting ATPase subunit K